MDFSPDLFFQESRSLLQILEQDLVSLEEAPRDGDLLQRIFRNMHTLKGSGAMFGFENISAQAHAMENAFDSIRAGKMTVTRGVIEESLAGLDRITAMLEDPDLPPHVEGWQEVTEAACGMTREDSAPCSGKQVFHLRFHPAPGILQNGTRLRGLFHELASLGPVQISAQDVRLPSWDSFDPTLCYLDFDILLVTPKSEESVREVFLFVESGSTLSVETIPFDWDGDKTPLLGEILQRRCHITDEQIQELLEAQKQNKKLGELAVMQGIVDEEELETALEEQKFLQKQKKTRDQTSQAAALLVSDQKVNAAVDLVGELVTLKERLSLHVGEVKDPVLDEISEELDFLVSDLRERIMGMRLVPLQNMFVGFRRIVRDLSVEMGKEVDLEIEGGETELDKTVMDSLKSCLVHMIRNSIDHGIESPQDRMKRGKSSRGKISLRARYVGSQVEIDVADDGAGIDIEKVRQKAVAQGLLSPDSSLLHDEVLGLLSRPGFSTASRVTSVSGRGVGTDAVLAEVEKLAGHLFLDFREGQGTTFTIRIPLTLAIIDSLQVRLGDHHFSIHLNDVKECFILPQARQLLSSTQRILHHQGKPLPLVDLRGHLGIGGSHPELAHVVVVDSGFHRGGIVVDEIIGQNQVVIKPLKGLLGRVAEISSSTILGDGDISLILDIPRLLESLSVDGEIIEEISKNNFSMEYTKEELLCSK
ncbi:two-component system, chemotaxis family, sensor kinase CheA [Alkalispirochaeta americana]|uniref:Chemotaxis protein CheA n=1 Tax=Alkalispirochaeta americana TaxID=159291 RepID=A0A1N6QVR1_9SPIO|nr:chemotaxis protein CheA [Alkalispirochaeta americana]SIQ20675.1 two-component system, chemotaxis family, sensor kinase CheA [Alkalispirochaeta americana]